MPVYERGYKHWEPSGRRADPAWWVIARRGIAEPLRRRRFLILLVIAWVPAVVKGGILYFFYKAGRLAELFGGSWADIQAPGFHAFLEKQKYFVLILLAVVGTRLVARDREENGLALYFARPLTLVDYVAGKGAVILFYFFAVTLFPVYALSVYGYLVTAGGTGLDMLLLTPLRATVYCALSGASIALVLLALSSIGTRAVFITMAWVILWLGSDQIADILTLLGGDWLRIIDFPAQYSRAGAVLFGATPASGPSGWLSLVLVVAYTALAVAVLRRRIRPVEIVS
jgi:ABC-type transport system involved in multi-copper enzyme maturation permease subunit